MILTKLSETTTTITLGWTPVPGAKVYLLWREKSPTVPIPSGGTRPRYTQIFDPLRDQAVFAKDSAWYKVEALGVEDSGQYPSSTPEPSTRPGIGALRFGSANPPSSPSRYDLLVSSWDKASVFGALPSSTSRRCLHYMSQVSLVDYPAAGWHAGVPLNWARSNGVVLQKQGGGELMNVSYGRPLGDLGSSVYQDEWIRNVQARLTATGLEGVFIDDTQYWYDVMTNGAISVKYPTKPQWLAAIGDFAEAVSVALRPRFYVAYNATGYHNGNTEAIFSGDPDLALFQALAPYADGLMCEYWQARPNIPGQVRKSGAGWTNHWDEWQRLPAFCAQANVDFLGNVVTADARVRDYVLASLLLDGGTFVWSGTNYASGDDPWNSTYEKVRSLGAPTGAKVKIGSRWQRPYAGGTVWVDPAAGTASI